MAGVHVLSRSADCFFAARRDLLFVPPIHSFAVAPDIAIGGVERPVSVVLHPFWLLIRKHEISQRFLLAKPVILIDVKSLPHAIMLDVAGPYLGTHHVAGPLSNGMKNSKVFRAIEVIISFLVAIDDLCASVGSQQHALQECRQQAVSISRQAFFAHCVVHRLAQVLKNAEAVKQQDLGTVNFRLNSPHKLETATPHNALELLKFFRVGDWSLFVSPRILTVRLSVKTDSYAVGEARRVSDLPRVGQDICP